MKSIESLQYEKSKIDLEIAKCKAAIREMVGEAKEKRRFAPIKQFNEIQIKVKRLGQDSQKLQCEIGELNRNRKSAKAVAIDRCFVMAAKEILPYEKFLSLLSIAQEMSLTTPALQPNQQAPDDSSGSNFSKTCAP